MTAKPPIVEMRNIEKNFGGIHAVSGMNLELYEGEVLGLLGHNGAGKSTLIKLLSGAYAMSSGEIRVYGQKVTIDTPRDAKALGIRDNLPDAGARR